MAADDFFESEVALAAAATAAVCSPRVRGVLRRGVVLGVAGATVAARGVAGTAEKLGRGLAEALPIGNRATANGSGPPARTPVARAAAPARRAATAKASATAKAPGSKAAKAPAVARAARAKASPVKSTPAKASASSAPAAAPAGAS